MIELVVFDIDGVLTDGSVLVDSGGQEIKRLNIKDIDAVYEIKRRGYRIAAITGEDTQIVSYFRTRFPWDRFLQGQKRKKEALRLLCEELDIDLAVVARGLEHLVTGDGEFALLGVVGAIDLHG